MAGWIKKQKYLSLSLLMALLLGLFWLAQRQESTKAPKAIITRTFDSIPVSVAQVSRAVVRDSFSTTGTVEAFREADIFSESAGQVRRVSAEPGEHKKRGDLLFLLDNELASIRQKKAEAYYGQKKRDLERYRNLYNEGAIPLSAYETVQLQSDEAGADFVAASRKNSDARVKSPFSGVITARFVELGELVHEGMKVAHIADLTRVKIIIFVPEREIMKFVEGTLLSVTSDLFPGESFSGKVSSVSEKSGRDHTYRVDVILHNPGKASFRSGMFARVLSLGNGERQAVLVPRIALVSGIRKPELFVVRRGKAFLTPFIAGRELHKSLEVIGGVAPGDTIVISGQNELHDGASVLVIDQKKSPTVP